MTLVLRAALVWRGTIVAERICPEGQLRVGDNPNAHFNAPLPGDEVLAEVGDETATIFVEQGARMTIRSADGLHTHQEGPVDVALRPGEAGILHSGDLAVFFQWVDMADARYAGSILADYNIASAVAASAAAHAAFLLAAFLLADVSVAAEGIDLSGRFVSILVADPPDVIEELEVEAPQLSDATGASASGEEGRMGVEDSPVDDTVLPEHDGESVDPLEQTELGDAVESAIALSGALTNVFGSTDNFSNSFGRDFALAGDGNVFVVGRGPGGLARHGTGPGGGGNGPPRFTELGGIDGPPGPGVGGSLRRREAVAPSGEVELRRPTVDGFLTRQEIERVVQRHARGIRYCYERELTGDGSVGGRVSATWTVDLDGRVTSSSISENSVSDEVGQCVQREIRRMRFPRPDGGMVVVTYPFSFRASS